MQLLNEMKKLLKKCRILYYIVPWNKKGEFLRLAYSEAGKKKLKITLDEIFEMFYEVEHKISFVKAITQAEKSNIHVDIKNANNLYINRKENPDYKEIISIYVKAKQAKLNIELEEIIDLYTKNRNVKKIVDEMIAEHKAGVKVELKEHTTLFYNGNDNQKLLKLYISGKKVNSDITPEQLSTAFFKNIPLEKFINTQVLLKKNELVIPDKIIFELLSDNINIIKLIEILSRAKTESINELQKHNLFEPNEAKKLANTYIVEGKEKFKKQLDEILINKNILKDPAHLYMKLIKSTDKGFKFNLEILKPYLTFDFKPQLDEIVETFLNARTNGLHITLEQLVGLAQNEVDIKNFIDAQIKSGING